MFQDVFFLTSGEFIAPSVAALPARELPFAPALMRLSNTIGVAVRSSGDVVLVDVGWSEQACAEPIRALGRFHATTLAGELRPGDAVVNQLEKLGIDRSRVVAVVATHMHLDHIGGVVDFPNAELICSQRELDAYWGLPPNIGYRAPDLKGAGRIRIVPLDSRESRGFPGSADVFGDGEVTLFDARGHTKGEVAVRIEGPTGTFLHVGDAAYFAWEYGRSPSGPSLLSRLSGWNTGEMKKTYGSIRRFSEREPEATVVTSHDARIYERLPHRPLLRAV